MHRLKNVLGWGLLILAGLIGIALVVFIVFASIVTIWVAGGALLIWCVSGEVAPGWERVPTAHAWVGFSCLTIMLTVYAWTLWDDLKWKMRLH